jgi:pyridoxal phosphate enzyme (YggS family)
MMYNIACVMIRDNLSKINERIASACLRADAAVESVTLLAVSKNRSVSQIEETLAAGIKEIGENRIQEAVLKHSAILRTPYAVHARWHMVGHLQTNKVKEAVRIFDLVQSVDSLRLAKEIDRQAANIGKVQDVLIEVKTSGEATKFGFVPEETIGAVKEIASFKNTRLQGLMTIAPLVDDPEKARPYFKTLKELFDEINRLSTIDHRLSTLSMGMTDDFEIAIEEGSNMVRLGRAIFD